MSLLNLKNTIVYINFKYTVITITYATYKFPPKKLKD